MSILVQGTGMDAALLSAGSSAVSNSGQAMEFFLNATDLLANPDLLDNSLVCNRNTQTVDANGIAVNTITSTSFSGVVIQAHGTTLIRSEDASYIRGSIFIITEYPLTTGTPTLDADIVLWNSQQYVVSGISNHSTYSTGSIVASCDLITLSGA